MTQRILVSSAGRRAALVGLFQQAAKVLDLNVQLIACDLEPKWSPACYMAEHSRAVPKCTDESYVACLLEICQEFNVKLLVPTIDTELLVLAKAKDQFAKIGVRVLVSDAEAVAIFRDKYKTFEHFKNHGITTPRSWLFDGESRPGDLVFPVIAKPVDGSCSQGIFIASSWEELVSKQQKGVIYVLQSILEGQEYTINAFVSSDRKLIASVPHWRKRVRDGEVCFAQTCFLPEFEQVAQEIVKATPGLIGPFCFQGFLLGDGSVSIFELNPRFGGGYPIADKAGLEAAKWLLQETFNLVPDYTNKWQDGLRMLRYDDAVFVGA